MRIRAVPLQQDVVKHARPALIALFVAVGMLLLIACANVAHLQLTTESLLLSTLAGALGLFLGWLATRWLAWMNPANLPRVDGISIDGGVLLFTIAISALAAVLFGLIPAFRAARVDVNSTLRAGSWRKYASSRWA